MLKDFINRIYQAEQCRFDWLMHLNRTLLFKKPAVSGSEYLKVIPQGKPLIIVTSHFSDADLQMVFCELKGKLREHRPGRMLAVSCQSENFTDFLSAFFIKLAGKKRFFGIDAYFDKKLGRLKFTFNAENFKTMAQALKSGTDIIIAAHEPLSNIPNSAWALPQRSGLGAVYLAQIADAAILPVAVNIQTNQHVGITGDWAGTIKRLLLRDRPQVGIVIGQPIFPAEINEKELKLLSPYLRRKTSGIRAEQVFKAVVEQGNLIMKSLASLLPMEKRGGW